MSQHQCHQSRRCWRRWLPLENISKRKGHSYLFLSVHEFTELWLEVSAAALTLPGQAL